MMMTDQPMTPTLDPVVGGAVVDEAVAVIDAALAQMMQRELVSATEVADLLLDVRTLLTK